MDMKTFKWHHDHEEKIKDFFFGDFCTKYIFKQRNQPPSLDDEAILIYNENLYFDGLNRFYINMIDKLSQHPFQTLN
jgi:hypothetical protein